MRIKKMSYASIQSTVDLYTQREAQLTNHLSDILNSVALATRQSGTLADKASTSRRAVMAEYDKDDDEYKPAMDEIQNEYQDNLAHISSWESELEIQKEEMETEIQATSTYKESLLAALKQNVQKDSKYGGSQ